VKNAVNYFMKDSGQTTVEYSIMLVMFLLIALVMIVLIDAMNNYGYRLLSLVGLDYP